MKIEEVRSKTDAELGYELESMKKELFDLRFRSATETTGNPARIRVLRRAIARINTVLHERTKGIRGQERASHDHHTQRPRRVAARRRDQRKMDQTITVEVERTYKHPKYGKYVRRKQEVPRRTTRRRNRAEG